MRVHSRACEGHKEPSGTYAVDTLLANVHKQNVTRFPYEIARLAQDIAGGLPVTMPSEKDFTSPECGKWLNKYFGEDLMSRPSISCAY